MHQQGRKDWARFQGFCLRQGKKLCFFQMQLKFPFVCCPALSLVKSDWSLKFPTPEITHLSLLFSFAPNHLKILACTLSFHGLAILWCVLCFCIIRHFTYNHRLKTHIHKLCFTAKVKITKPKDIPVSLFTSHFWSSDSWYRPGLSETVALCFPPPLLKPKKKGS